MSGEIISLDSIARLGRGGRPKPACAGGSPSAGAGIDPRVWERIKDHPCYNEDAHHDFARVHVAVAPACNIQCNYCNRKYDCANESRPGVVSERLTPEEALRKVAHIAQRLPQLSVVGIAGPGDALANPKWTFRTFDLISRELPHLKLCLSTNGLALPDYIDIIRDFGIDHVTITINMVDPAVGAGIYRWVFFDHRRWSGEDASRILHERQMAGLEALTAAGVLVKINSVLIPGVNDHHLGDVATAIRARGAFLHNVMPLISDASHGTAFGLEGRRGPTPEELDRARDALGGSGARLMRHCRQCRADAVGLLGENLEACFTLDQLPDTVPADDSAARDAYRDHIEREWEQRRDARDAATRRVAAAGSGSPLRLKVAVASRGGDRINLHFGKASEFLVYEVDASGIRLMGPRRTDNYCQGGYGDKDNLESVIQALAGVDVILVAQVGGCPRTRLEEAGFTILDDHAHEYIEPAIAACFAKAQRSAAQAVA